DFDIISFLLGKKCISLSSYGSLKYFNSKNKPQGATDYCYDCPCKSTCPYDAYKIYLTNDVTGLKKGNTSWPCDTVVSNPTEEKLIEALKRSRYGRCVFASDNNVVDHQVTAMEFEDQITATFTMSAFSAFSYREITIMGTLGEIRGNQHTGLITVTPFGQDSIVYDINKLETDLSGHGGGDNRMLRDFFEALDTKQYTVSSTIENSMQSHFMAFAAEKSRLEGGKRLTIQEITQK
ncbi:MAG TPA: gfo/Idh/MocA family oxidoreductase, partial [Clostridia bacterium]